MGNVLIFIPDYQHVTRYIGARRIHPPSADGRIKPDSSAFLPRPDYPKGFGPEEFVSVDWLEYFEGDLTDQLNGVRRALSARMTLGAHAKLAILNVGETKAAGAKNGKSLVIKTISEPNDPSHSGIYGLTPDDDIIAQEIANHAVLKDAQN